MYDDAAVRKVLSCILVLTGASLLQLGRCSSGATLAVAAAPAAPEEAKKDEEKKEEAKKGGGFLAALGFGGGGNAPNVADLAFN